MMQKKLLILGFITGFFSAALGVGGGVILVSGMMLLCKYDMKKVVGTSLLTMIPVVLVGFISHYIINSNNLKIITMLCFAAGAVAGARLGVFLSAKIHSRVLVKMFAILLIFIGLKLIGLVNYHGGASFPVEKYTYSLLVLGGVFAGAFSSLFGIGGGVIIVPALTIFFGLSIHEAVTTSLAVILPTAIVGAILHGKYKNIDKEASSILLPTALAGAVLGAIFSEQMPGESLRVWFGIFLILCAVKLFFNARKSEAL